MIQIMPKVRKAVFPVAGLGTRFLPATKASPKEMLTVVDKPVIQYAVEEAIESGITQMIFVTGRSKRAIEDHFDKAYELESELEKRGKQETLAKLREILPKGIECAYIRQPEALGLGHAVLCAKNMIGNEPFAVILSDELMDTENTVLKSMVDVHAQTGNSVIAVQQVPPQETDRYGIVEMHKQGGFNWIRGIVEKPKPADAKSNLAVVGRYILNPKIFHHLETTTPGVGGEIQLTDAIAAMLKEEPMHAMPFLGMRYDCGSKLGYLQASLVMGMRHPEVGKDFETWVKQLLSR